MDEKIPDVDIGLIGVPWDGGTTNRPGARHGPRQVRDISTMVRNVNRSSGIKPFDICNCADLGDTPVNPVDLIDSMNRITAFYDTVCKANIAPLSVGGDHLVTLPILRALAKDGPVGMVHFDAHTDTWNRYLARTFTHMAPPFGGRSRRDCWIRGGPYKSVFVGRCTTTVRMIGGNAGHSSHRHG